MALYRFSGRDRWGDYVAGVVEAADTYTARFVLQKTYNDYIYWEDVTLVKAVFDDNGVCEVYYG